MCDVSPGAIGKPPCCSREMATMQHCEDDAAAWAGIKRDQEREIMERETTSREWISKGHSDEPRDQEIDLGGGWWAEVGPESDGRWAWNVFDKWADARPIAGGNEASEGSAKYCAVEGAKRERIHRATRP